MKQKFSVTTRYVSRGEWEVSIHEITQAGEKIQINNVTIPFSRVEGFISGAEWTLGVICGHEITREH